MAFFFYRKKEKSPPNNCNRINEKISRQDVGVSFYIQYVLFFSSFKNLKLTLLVKNNMNEFSASIYIDVYCNFRKGTLFDRTINEDAYRYYLKNIYVELGDEGLKMALQSLKKLLVRRERDKPAPPCIYKIYDEFQEKLTKQ